MAKEKVPATPALRQLRQAGASFTAHLYTYEEHGGTAVSARELGVEEHRVIKTLVMEDETKNPLIILMHGDLQVSTKELARQLGVKNISPCAPEVAHRHTGYQVGGTSPFGTRKSLPICMEETIRELPSILINAGKRGFLVEISTMDLMRILAPQIVRVGIS